MSISTRHSILPFVSGQSKALHEQRLVKVGYKSIKNAPLRFPSVCVSVPVISEIPEDFLESLLPHLVGVLETAQDGIVRSLYESSDGSLREVGDSDISVEACISWLEATRERNGRLTGERIRDWFESEVSENLSVILAEKLGFTELGPKEEKVIGKHLGEYKEVLASLASHSPSLDSTQIKSCKAAIGLASSEGKIGEKMTEKLIELEKPVQKKQLLEL